MTSSWVPVADGSPFPVTNLPYGAFSTGAAPPRVGVAIGDHVLDLSAAAAATHAGWARLVDGPSLDALLASGPATWHAVRHMVTGWLCDSEARAVIEPCLVPLPDVELHLPFTVTEFVDFYASEHHAANAGRILRPGQAALTPNWRHLPVGYHGRSGSVVVSGTPVRRPSGQRRDAEDDGPVFGPTERLDFEAEVGFVVGTGSAPGTPVPVTAFDEHVFGVCLVNDWSARDIQAWEYQPLGPFLGKSFATSVSAWVVPLEALRYARRPVASADSDLLPYLRETRPWGLDLVLEVRINGEVVSRPPYAAMHWSPAQMLAHLTVNGARVRTGELYASGTVSGPADDQCGSLLELTRNGSRPLRLADGSTRGFLADGDDVVISATAPGAHGAWIGLGEVRGRVLPALADWVRG